MSLKTGLFAHLTADPAIAAAVGAKIFPAIAPQDTAEPFIVYDVGDDEEYQFHSGASGLHQATIEVRAQAENQPEAEALGGLIFAALRATDGAWGAIAVARVAIKEPEVIYVPGTDRTDTFQASVAVEVQYYE